MLSKEKFNVAAETCTDSISLRPQKRLVVGQLVNHNGTVRAAREVKATTKLIGEGYILVMTERVL